MAELNKMAAVQSNIPDRQLFESSLPVAERVLALVLECLLEPLPLGPCTNALLMSRVGDSEGARPPCGLPFHVSQL